MNNLTNYIIHKFILITTFIQFVQLQKTIEYKYFNIDMLYI